eukprot:TRINITY_DN4148_c0_g1_i1.p1 TRINITY_DN4148_c0_g1~~TRINITY_DN4148_c0_g1_i1.p1  ORF type:complete len:249 (+),score=43.54 TRINITY_DN4148_c0_g1_i1:105-749(+)
MSLYPTMDHHAGGVSAHGMGTIYGTTILSVRKNNKVVMIGDGQMSLGNTIVKHKTRKVRRIRDVLVGVAGSTADAATLLERFEKLLDESNGQLVRATVGLAKLWRTDRSMARLQAVMCLSDHSTTLLFDGDGNVIEPDDGRLLAIGSGGSFALAAARALIDHSNLDAEQIAKQSMTIAADLCVYTNHNFVWESLASDANQNTSGAAASDAPLSL